jgi:urease accessory protein
MNPATPPAVSGQGWHARLDLAFAARAGVTRLAHNRHEGPLRLIRALPLPQGRCQAVIVHPPGGLVGGDRLEIDVALEEDAQVLCTTPGAQKWYRAHRDGACARTRIKVASGATLEWLPQPTIVYDAAQVDQSLSIDLMGDARMIGWECMVMGRAAMKERFLQGMLRQSVELSVDGRARWHERTVARASDRVFDSSLGWGGRTVACTVWAVSSGARPMDGLRDTWRSSLAAACETPEGVHARMQGATSLVEPGLLVARLLADDAQSVMVAAQGLWAAARPVVIGAPGDPPRIWAT